MKKLFFFFLCLIGFTACRKNSEIKFDNSQPLALIPNVQWALVIEPYAAYRSLPDWSADVKGHCKKYDIINVLGSKACQNEIWYLFEEGWLPQSCVKIYSNRFKALTAASQI